MRYFFDTVETIPEGVGFALFGTNFMFLMYAEAGNPLMWFEKTFGSYLVGFPVLGAAVILVMYTPVLLHTRRKGKQDAKGHRLAAR